MKMYAIFERDTDFENKMDDQTFMEDAFHESLSIPTLAWKDNTNHGFVEWDKDKKRLSHFIFFPTRKAAEEEVFELEDLRPADYVIKEIEINI